jgi:hypothetical protein
MRIVKNYSVAAFVLLAVGLFITSCQKTTTPDVTKTAAQYSSDVVSSWNDLFLVLERYAAGYRPGPAPRAMAYIGLANYEACISGMPNFNSQANNYAGLSIPAVESGKEYHWPTVVNASSAFLMRKFFPNASDDNFKQITTLENANNADFQKDVSSAEVFNRSVAYGQAVAAAVWAWENTDTWGHDAYLNPFKDPDNPNTIYDWHAHQHTPTEWQPVGPGPQNGMFPFWGKVRTFAISEADKLSKKPLPSSDATNSPLYAQALEVYSLTINPTYENQWIAEFWSDDLVNLTFSPGPRFLAIATEVYRDKKASLETAVYSNAKLGMAISDGVVACWNSKYVYNVERPVSYIKRLIDPNWKPNLNNPLLGQQGVTPAFPAYPSGHSTMAGAASEILSDIFGLDYSMTDSCHKNRPEFNGTPRYFNSFNDMADEDAWSRVPLGVHFRMDCVEGEALGKRCGHIVNSMSWKK